MAAAAAGGIGGTADAVRVGDNPRRRAAESVSVVGVNASRRAAVRMRVGACRAGLNRPGNKASFERLCSINTGAVRDAVRVVTDGARRAAEVVRVIIADRASGSAIRVRVIARGGRGRAEAVRVAWNLRRGQSYAVHVSDSKPLAQLQRDHGRLGQSLAHV